MQPLIKIITTKYTKNDDDDHLDRYAGIPGILVKVFPGILNVQGLFVMD